MCDDSKGTATYRKGSFLSSCSPLITAKHHNRWLHSQYTQVDSHRPNTESHHYFPNLPGHIRTRLYSATHPLLACAVYATHHDAGKTSHSNKSQEHLTSTFPNIRGHTRTRYFGDTHCRGVRSGSFPRHIIHHLKRGCLEEEI